MSYLPVCYCHSSGGTLPHDLTMASGMLYVMVVMRTGFEQRNFEDKVEEVTTNWLSEGTYSKYVICDCSIILRSHVRYNRAGHGTAR